MGVAEILCIHAKFCINVFVEFVNYVMKNQKYSLKNERPVHFSLMAKTNILMSRVLSVILLALTIIHNRTSTLEILFRMLKMKVTVC